MTRTRGNTRTPRNRFDQYGVTLIELAVVMVIVGLVIVFAAPSFSQFLAGQNAGRTTRDLYASLTLARSEAIKRNRRVTLDAIGGDWTAGWRTLDPADASKVLDAHDSIGDLAVTGPAAVQFSRSGRVVGSVAPVFEISSPRFTAMEHHCIYLDLSGRPSLLKKPSC